MSAKAMEVNALANLSSIVSEIQVEHELARASAQDAVAHAINAGRLLLTAKAQTAHGQFAKWVAANFTFSQRTATDYMRVARAPAEKQIGSSAADLSIRSITAPTQRRARVESAKPKRTKLPTLSDQEYRALRQTLINSVIARTIPSVKKAAAALLGTDELMQLREAVCAVVDQYINRADKPNKSERAHLVVINKETAA